MLVSLRKLANLATGENSRVSGLEVILHDQTAVVHQTVLVNNMEDFLVNISDARSDQETDIQTIGFVF